MILLIKFRGSDGTVNDLFLCNAGSVNNEKAENASTLGMSNLLYIEGFYVGYFNCM